MTLKETENFFTKICFTKDISHSFLQRYLKKTSSQNQKERILIYRKLVHQNIFGILQNILTTFQKTLSQNDFESLVQDFIFSKQMKSHFFRDLHIEFCNHITPKLTKDIQKQALEYDVSCYS